MARKKSSRKFQLTINNPIEKGYCHDTIKEVLKQFSLVYWCMCDEIGREGTYHTHIFFIAKSAVMFDTVKKRFYGAHIETVFGSNIENYNYIRKIGEKYEDKKETNLAATFEEWGNLPDDIASGNSLSGEVVEMIRNGSSDIEIVDTYPSMMYKINSIRMMRNEIDKDRVKNTFRNLEVYYLWGKTGTGKTRYVMDKYGYSNVYRVTDYEHPFDGYAGEKVILFDEFRSSLKITDMLYYLDGYPVTLPCRYSNKAALYETVYFTTNVPLEKQYQYVQSDEPETFKAFCRRIDKITEFKNEMSVKIATKDENNIEIIE